MSETDINLLIGGPQGGGIDSAANMISRAFALAGYNVFGVREYHSNIKGRHSYIHYRIMKERPRSLKYPVDFMVALDPDTVFEHMDNVGNGTKVIYDSSFDSFELKNARMMNHDTMSRVRSILEEASLTPDMKGISAYLKSKGAEIYSIPFEKLITQNSVDGPATRYYNTLGAAITVAMLGLDEDHMDDGIRYAFRGKDKVIETNLKVVKSGYDYVKSLNLKIDNLEVFERKPRLMLSGNDAVTIGKLMGGLRFQTYYPITPASDESTLLEAHEDVKLLSRENEKLKSAGVVVVQTEDELAAVNMANGAALTGTRSATATSGPGFSLMAEGISFAGMTEIPVVVTFYQRGGPSTGLPTRNGQADLLFALNTGHGEFPRIVISSGDVEECIYDAMKALNYAQRYQMPVIHVIDKNLANTMDLIPTIDPKKVKLIKSEISNEKLIKRYMLDTSNGISPMGVFGRNIFWMTGDEHDELGHVTEDPFIRDRMMEKRMKKLETADSEIPLEDKAILFGDENADITYVTWGSQKGPILDAIEELKKDGINANLLYIKMFEPFPSEFVKKVLGRARLIINVESNMTAQAAKVIRMNTGIEIENNILKYNGRHMTLDEILKATKDIIKKNGYMVVLNNGS
ncbi:2-oxoacid:ferredoxin oxidoreductase subunit alpha [Picrophilus oshimae]|uniref:2-oxoglutarate synthase subunit KorA n=1 Tax=Picrophilus torridus (strain ATCC 700027 / DSM 9790 / JCM 10055 / NBRC 100828 / KAW 2/3) TaxID=1122961 RepID=Q6L0B7_PICTO|nr:2-oxoacid:ferredoxin oxidoreductase subunit alpha [Picrophilus oshimae]AAT43585.1 2-oxoglutarate synthase, alpha chain [Picrophilus oshimae DSM 9789]